MHLGTTTYMLGAILYTLCFHVLDGSNKHNHAEREVQNFLGPLSSGASNDSNAVRSEHEDSDSYSEGDLESLDEERSSSGDEKALNSNHAKESLKSVVISRLRCSQHLEDIND